MSFKITEQELREIVGKRYGRVNDSAPVVDRIDPPAGGVRLTREQMAGKSPRELLAMLDALAEKQTQGIPADSRPDVPNYPRTLEALLAGCRGRA